MMPTLQPATQPASFRLIGEHGIKLAKYSYRLFDTLVIPNEDKASRVRLYALGTAAHALRDAGALFNKVTTDEAELNKLESCLELYYNLHCLFLPESGNLTVWTMAKAIPYYARKLYDEYGAGYGVVSMQEKEAKNATIKSDLKLTNRSKEEGELNKFHQIFHMEYMRAFWLEEHSPSPSRYNPHFNCRVPSHVGTPGYCDCGREIGEEQLAVEDPELQVTLCSFCVGALEVVACAREGELTPDMACLLSTAKVSINPLKGVLEI
ncbi:Hypp2443 [Branchiostoma lanceolatum]|uniref:Hypp2443 protein n=1 Tax=Branchiostoma lanceolatum TaxID=7740 RepID=A0A8J9ZS49_BRALA|nr:Hypp2443 [Branchiostoma lanceolatum]